MLQSVFVRVLSSKWDSRRILEVLDPETRSVILAVSLTDSLWFLTS
jgi:hypothetical protein